MLVHESSDENKKYVFRLSKEELVSLTEENLEGRLYVCNMPTEKKFYLSYDQRQEGFLEFRQGYDALLMRINDVAWRIFNKNYYWKGTIDDIDYEFFIRGYMDRYRNPATPT